VDNLPVRLGAVKVNESPVEDTTVASTPFNVTLASPGCPKPLPKIVMFRPCVYNDVKSTVVKDMPG
jgi:hypothetical protein